MFYKQFGDMTKNLPYPMLLDKKADFKQLVVDLSKDYFSAVRI
jgi:hypothetical protein